MTAEQRPAFSRQDAFVGVTQLGMEPMTATVAFPFIEVTLPRPQEHVLFAPQKERETDARLQDVLTACYTEHRVKALVNYFAEHGTTSETAHTLLTAIEDRLDGPVAPEDITLPDRLVHNTNVVRTFMKDQMSTLREALTAVDPNEHAPHIAAFITKHHKHIAWAHAENGLFAANEGMNVRLRVVKTLDNIADLQPWFSEVGIGMDDVITQKHVLSKSDREKLVNPLLPYGFQTVEPVTEKGVHTGLTEALYADGLLTAASIIKHSRREIKAQVSGDTWTLDPNNFQPVRKADGSFYDDPVRYPDGKPFAAFGFVLNPRIAGPSWTRRRIGTATIDGPYKNQWDFAAADPRRKALLEQGYDLGVYAQVRLPHEFIPAMETLACDYNRTL